MRVEISTKNSYAMSTVKKVVTSAGSLTLAGLLGLLLSKCVDSTLPVFTQPPVVSANPNPAVPLGAVLRFSTEEAVRTVIEVSDGKHKWKLTYDGSHNPQDGLAVIGMRPGRRHEMRVSIRDANGNIATIPETLEYTTPPLPSERAEFPPIRVTVRKPEKMEPGFTLFSPRRRRIGDLKFGQSFGMLLAIDAQGEVVWYYRTDSRISDLERLRNGNIMYLTQDYRVVEIDMLGNVVQTWYASGRPLGPTEGIPIQTLAVHHEVDELPSGNLVILGVEKRAIDNYYTSAYDAKAPRKTQNVMGDEIIEFQRDGKVVWRWKAFDDLDSFRIGYQTFGDYWVRRGFPDTVDWTHANGLLHDERDDSLLVNMRIQSAVLKLDRSTGEIRWILGEPSGWPKKLQDRVLKLEGETRWFHHQHAPVPTPIGTLLLFDNGNFQARPFTPPVPPAQTYSRAVEYAIDEENMTVREVWASEGPGPDAVVTFAMGDVDWLPETGNVLVHYGFIFPRNEIEKVTWEAPRFKSWSRIREYTHTTPPEVVWEVVLEDKSDEDPIGWSIFGGDRLPSLSR